MPTIQVRFVSGKSWDSKLIEWYSRCKWSHVEFLFPGIPGPWGAMTITKTFGAQLRGGLRWRYISDQCYAKAKRYDVWEIPVTDDQYARFMTLISDAEGALYDWPAILSFVLGQHRWHLKGRYICSGFEAGVFLSLMLLAINFPIENYTPRDIFMLVPQIKGARRI